MSSKLITKPIKHWSVMTPEYTEWGNDYSEPPESVIEWVFVEARTKREAISKSIKEFRKKYPTGYIVSDNLANPFKGLKAEISECEHGVCWCDLCDKNQDWFECPECLAKWEAEAQNI